MRVRVERGPSIASFGSCNVRYVAGRDACSASASIPSITPRQSTQTVAEPTLVASSFDRS